MRSLLLILGASGSGKSTLCAELERRYGLKSIPSYTTRQPRFEGEQGHTFITEDEFDKLEDILAYAKTDNCRYAVTKEMLENEEYSVYVVDTSGLLYLYDHYRGGRPLISVFIDSDVYDRFNRMVSREDDRTHEEKVKAALTRIEHDSIEFNIDLIRRHVNYIFKNIEGRFNDTVNMVSCICQNYGIIGDDND